MALTFDPNELQTPQPITMEFDPVQKGVPPDAVESRAQKYDFAMGADSPGIPAIQSDLQSTGGEYVKQQQLNAERLRFEKAKTDALLNIVNSQQGRPIDNNMVNLVMGMSRADFNEAEELQSIMETSYAKKFMSTLVQIDPSQSFTKAGEASPEGANVIYDLGEEAIARNEVAHTILDDIVQKKKDQSWPGAIGDFLGVVMPMSNMRLNNLVKMAPTTSILPGNNVGEQIAYLHSLPVNEFRRQLQTAVDSMPNLQLAHDFATAVISMSDQGVFLSNLITVVDTIDAVAIGKAAMKGVTGLARKVGSGKVAQPLANVVRGAVQGSQGTGANPGAIAQSIGNIQGAAIIKTVRNIMNAPIKDAEKVSDAAVSLTNPSKLLTNAAKPLSREASQRLTESVQSGAVKARAILELDTVDRTGLERAVAIADDTARRLFANLLRSVQSAILDIDAEGFPIGKIALTKVRSLYPPITKVRGKPVNPPTVTSSKKFTVEPVDLTNSEVMHIAIGQKNGMLFGNVQAAEKFAAQNMPDIHRSSFEVIPQGSGYYLDLRIDLPDRLDNFQHLSIPIDKHSESLTSMLLGRVGNVANLLSVSNSGARRQVTHGSVNASSLLQDLMKPIADLYKADRAELDKVLKIERDTVQPNGKRGINFKTLGEFQQEYQKQNGHWPSEAATKAYYATLQLYQLEGMVGNARAFADDVRVGKYVYYDTYNTPGVKGIKSVKSSFKGKEVDTIPWDDGKSAAIAIKQDDGTFRVIQKFEGNRQKTNKAVPKVKGQPTAKISERQLIADMQAKGARIIQVAEPNFMIPGASTTTNIRFVVTPTSQRGRVSMYQFWRDGQHVFDNSTHYVKQGHILWDKAGKVARHIGDVSVLGAPSKKLAQEVAKHMEVARQMLLRNDPNLDSYVSRNVGDGIDGNDFRNLFKAQRGLQGQVIPALDPDVPFSWTAKNGSTGDNFKYNDYFKGQGFEFADEANSSYNLDGEKYKGFAIERGTTNIRVIQEEKGVRRILKDGDLLNPWDVMVKSAKKLIDVRLKRDYMLKSANDFVEQYEKYLEPSRDELFRNPLKYLYNPVYKDGIAASDKWSIENSRRAIVRFMSNLNPDESAIAALEERMLEGGKVQSFIAKWMLPWTKDVPGAVRQIGFMAKMGFTPVQLLMQGQTAAAALAISPKYGMRGVVSALPIRAALLNPNFEAHSLQTAKVLGWKEDHWKEMLEGLKRSGWDQVKGDQAILDQVEDPRLMQTAKGRIYDAGAFFAVEGEKINRFGSWATAYQEWKAANSNKTLDRAGSQWILARADNMTQNMSAANNAIWQRNLLAVPLQFYTYQMRLTEQYITSLAGRGTLSRGEALRLMALQGVMYGIPTAAGGAVGVWPIYDSVKAYLVDNHIEHDDVTMQAVLNGIPQVMLNYASQAVTGEEFNIDIGARFGSGGITGIRDWYLGKKSDAELLLGAGGTVVGDILANGFTGLRALWQWVADDPEDRTYPLDSQTVLRVFNSWTVVNQSYKYWYAMNYGRWLSKYGREIADVSPTEALVQALTGATMNRITRSYTDAEVLEMRHKTRDAATLQVIDYFARALRSEDDAARNEYMNIARSHAVMGGLTTNEWIQALTSAMGQVAEPKLDSNLRRIELDYIKRKAFEQGMENK